MKTRLIMQSGDTFYSALCDDNVITHFRSPFGVESLNEVFGSSYFYDRTPSQISDIPDIIRSTKCTNHILIPIDLTYDQFLDQYPEWNI